MDINIIDGVVLGLAFFTAFIVAHIIYSFRLKKWALAFQDSADKFKKDAYGMFITYNRDNLEVLMKMEAGDFDGAKHHISYGIALFYHNECALGLAEEFGIEKRKIEEFAKSSPILAANLERAAKMQKTAVEMKTSRK